MSIHDDVKDALAGAIVLDDDDVHRLASMWPHLSSCPQCRAAYQAAHDLLTATGGDEAAQRMSTAIGKARVLPQRRPAAAPPARRLQTAVVPAAVFACVALFAVVRDDERAGELQARAGDAPPAFVVRRLCTTGAEGSVHAPPCVRGERAVFAWRATTDGFVVVLAEGAGASAGVRLVESVDGHMVRALASQAALASAPFVLPPEERVAFVFSAQRLDAATVRAAAGGHLDHEQLAQALGGSARVLVIDGDEQ